MKPLVGLLGLAIFPSLAFGMSFGLGIRESAMANAGLAMWASAGALAHNPAASANLSPDRVVAGQTSFVQFESKANEGAQIESGDVQSMAPYIGSFYKHGLWRFGVGITSQRLNLSGSVPADLAANQPGFSFDNLVGETTSLHFSFSRKLAEDTTHEWATGGQISLERESSNFSATFPLSTGSGNVFFRSKSKVDSINLKWGSILRLNDSEILALVLSSNIATLNGHRNHRTEGGVLSGGSYFPIDVVTNEKIRIAESWNARLGYSKKTNNLQLFTDLNFFSNKRLQTDSVSTLVSPFLINPVVGLTWSYSDRWNLVGGLSTDLSLDQAGNNTQVFPKFAGYRPNHLLSVGLERNSRSDVFGFSASYSNDQQSGVEYQRLYVLNLFTSYDFNDE